MRGRRDGFVGEHRGVGGRPVMRRARWRSGHTLVIAAMLATACTRNGVADADGAPPGTVDAPARGRTLRVGNPSRGVDDQPDYDAMARELGSRVAPRLPDPLPPASDACREMLAALVEAHAPNDGAAAPEPVVRAVAQADRSSCERQTSPAAATCVAMLLRENAGEYPWLLDQCSRAFPKL